MIPEDKEARTRSGEEGRPGGCWVASAGIPLDDRVRAVLVVTDTVEAALEAIYGWD